MTGAAASGHTPAAPLGAEPNRSYIELARQVAAENDRRALIAQIHRPDLLTQMAMGAWRQQ
jgi:hypothetical protein